MYELTKQFRFDSAHTLQRTIGAEGSRRVHGHSYRAEVTLRGKPDPQTGMIIDLGLFECALAEAQQALDHRFLDEINDLGPATLENLSVWIFRKVAPALPGLARVAVYRDSASESCSYAGSPPPEA